MDMIADKTLAKRQPKDRSLTLQQKAIIRVLGNHPGASRESIVFRLGEAFKAEDLRQDIRGLIANGQVIEQAEGARGYCCYLPNQPRPHGVQASIAAGTVTTYVDPSLKGAWQQPSIAEVGSARLRDGGGAGFAKDKRDPNPKLTAAKGRVSKFRKELQLLERQLEPQSDSVLAQLIRQIENAEQLLSELRAKHTHLIQHQTKAAAALLPKIAAARAKLEAAIKQVEVMEGVQ
jgi:hypothetical protein